MFQKHSPSAKGWFVQTLKLFAPCFRSSVITDLFWLGVVMKNFYNQEIGDLARRDGPHLGRRAGSRPSRVPADSRRARAVRTPDIRRQRTSLASVASGALFGVVLYGVYDFTNLSVLEKWTVRMTLVDIAWGAVLCGTMSVVMSLLDHALTGHRSAL